jgi:hypothetical protein
MTGENIGKELLEELVALDELEDIDYSFSVYRT